MFDYPMAYPNINMRRYFPRVTNFATDKKDRVLSAAVTNVSCQFEYATQLETAICRSIMHIQGIRNVRPSSLSLIDYPKILYTSQEDRLELYEIKYVNSWLDLQRAIVNGHMVLIGGSAYTSFMTCANTFIIPLPKPGERVLGGVLLAAYFFDQQEDILRVCTNFPANTILPEFVRVPGTYIRNLLICKDFFVIKKV